MLGSQFIHLNSEKVLFIDHYPTAQGQGILKLISQRIWSIIKTYRSYKPDIIHVRNHMGDWLCWLFARILLPNSKIVLDIRTLSPNSGKHKYNLILSRIVTRKFDHIFALNKKIIDLYVSPDANVTLLPLGFDHRIFYPRSQDKTNRYTAGDRLKCIYYGSINKQRELTNLLSGFVDAIRSGCDIFLTLIGEGNDKSNLIALTENWGLKHHFIFKEFALQDKLAEEIQKNHLGISYVPKNLVFEYNPPLKTIEVLACGIPVLGTDTEGNKLFVTPGTNGYLAGDKASEISRALKKIYASGIPAAVFRNAHLTAENWSWETLAQKYLLPQYEKLFYAPNLHLD